MQVKDCEITNELETCIMNDTVTHLAKLVKDRVEINNIIVLENKKPIGIVSVRDIIDRVVAEDKDPNKVKALEIMSSPVMTATLDDDISKVAAIMVQNNFLSIPVVDENDELRGVVTVYDIVAKLREKEGQD